MDGRVGGPRILVVEDEYFIADDLRRELERAGATVVGPVGTVDAALAMIASDEAIDGGTIDVALGSETSFPVVERLIERGLPIVLLTGYDEDALPEHLRVVPRCEKPVSADAVLRALFGQA